ncbi:MAG: FkbM family methyltransferase [Halieaceae bacterium]|jgi:hypothetical protein|uniref:FkbM family methyltransferase n=1 Tax=Haliea alexandrii TaxID=2448162 RepID=UPI0013049793|nr:FkbM family methyltransferase [Haliea alexandrii]MCR9185345.1 FkbM family methyltransferase [Halieaceae bacterium]
MNPFKILSAISSGSFKGHFGQYGEDVIVRKLVKPNRGPGRYLDLGAFHPFRFSNTAYLWMCGWQGVNVDANANSIRLFDRVRRGDKNICAAVVSEAEIASGLTEVNLMLPQVTKTRDGISALGSISSDRAELKALVRAVPVPTLSVNGILAENSGEDIRYINIDIEGYDEKIACDIDLARFRPEVISVEEYGPNLAALVNSVVCQHLQAHDYQLFARAGYTSIYVREG